MLCQAIGAKLPPCCMTSAVLQNPALSLVLAELLLFQRKEGKTIGKFHGELKAMPRKYTGILSLHKSQRLTKFGEIEHSIICLLNEEVR